MIGSLMYLTALRPDIMFAVSACSRHQVTPLTSNLNAVKKIFKYLKGQPKLENLTTGGYVNSWVSRLISWSAKNKPLWLLLPTEARVLKIHTVENVADLLTKAFDGPRFNHLVVHIGMLNPRLTMVKGEDLMSFLVLQEFLLVALLVPTGRTIPTGLGSHIRYAITHDPIIYDSLVKQFWSTAYSLKLLRRALSAAILATIDRSSYTITESSVRSQLQLDDDGGVEDLPIADIYLGMDNLGYPTEGKLTFHKNKFSPQWRFLVHTILHCLSSKSGSWDQFGSSLAIALICLTEGRRYNWSSYIFKGMVNNINNPKKFLMFPRFLQMILEIEPKITKQYHAFKLTSKMFANMRLNFHGDNMPLLDTMLPPAQAAIAGESSGEAAQSNPQTVPETITEPDHSHDHAPTPPRPTTTTSSAPVNEQGPSSDPTIASSSRPHESAPDLFTSTNVEDETMGGSFHTIPPSHSSPPGSSQAASSRKDVDPLIKLAKAAAKAAAASAVPTSGSHEADIPPSSSVPSDEFAGGSDVPAGATIGPSTNPSNKGKSPLMEEDPPVRERTFRQREEDSLGEEAARRMYEEEQAELERERKETQKKRQQDVLNSEKYYTDSDWTDIMGQVHANQGLTADLLCPDVTEDNFAERMVALIAKRRRDFAVQRFKDKLNKPMTYAQQKAYMRTFVKNQSSTIYTTGWTMKHVKSFSDEQLKTEFDKIRAAVAELKSQNIRRSLKRPSANLEQDSSKKSKSTEAPKSSVPDDSQQPSVEVPSQKATKEDVEVTSNTTSTAQHTASSLKKVDGDPDAEHKMCLKYASDEDSASDDDTPVNFYHVVDWELLPTGLGSINVFYRKDKNSYRSWFIVLWGVFKVLMDFTEVNDVGGLFVHMFVDKKYPLSVNLIERMIDHQLEICHGTVGVLSPRLDADFLVAASKFMKVAFGVGFKLLLFNPLVYVVPTGRVKVPAGRYVVPTGKDNTVIVVAASTKVILLRSIKDKQVVGFHGVFKIPTALVKAGSKVVPNVGKHIVDPVLEHLDFMPSGATTLAKHVVEVRHVIWMNEIQDVVWTVGKILISKIWG
ncbi:hypothetical protein Tco_1030159 [Tanacetum coccineum]|uniref:Reverse transcriptase Ty1/copia-type domain-containing protein n=1 Tax=Tanacetum coccineum TaxID=301880 RepID=A0ABQ5G5G4_9ASTR